MGSFDISQSMAESVSNAPTAQGSMVQPHSLQPGTNTQTTIVYDGWPSNSLPAGAYTVGSGGCIANVVSGPDANGLYSRTITLQTVTWRTWTNSLSPDFYQWTNPNGDRQGKAKTWLGLDDALIDTAVSDCASGPPNADAGYVITGVRVSPGSMGSFDITQTEEQSVSNAASSQVSAINPHSICEGTRTRTTIVYDGWPSNTLPSPAYTVGASDCIENSVRGPDGAGLYSRTILTETVTWTTWTNTLAANITSRYDNAALVGEGITKTWCGIAKAAIFTALADVRAGNGQAAAQTNYTIFSAGVRDNQDGSITLTQNQIAQATITNAAVSSINKPGLFPGLLTDTTTLYENFAEGDLPAGTDPTTGNTLIRNEKRGPDGNGMFSRITVTRAATWTNLWAQAVQMSDGKTSDWGRVKGEMVEGVPIANRAATLSSALTPDAGFVVLGASLREGPDGSLVATRQQGTAFTNTTDVDTMIQFSDGDRVKEATRRWYRVTAAAKDTLIGSGGDAVTDFTWPGPGSSETLNTYRTTIAPHGDGTYDVYQHGVEDTTYTNFSMSASYDWNEYQVIHGGDGTPLRTNTFTRYIREWGSLAGAWQIIQHAGRTNNEAIVYGSTSVRKNARGWWEARWTVRN